MTDTGLVLIGIGVATILVILFYSILIRPSRVFESIFGVSPDSAKQEDVNKVIKNLSSSAEREGNKANAFYGSDDDMEGWVKHKLDRAKKFALKFNFEVPE